MSRFSQLAKKCNIEDTSGRTSNHAMILAMLMTRGIMSNSGQSQECLSYCSAGTLGSLIELLTIFGPSLPLNSASPIKRRLTGTSIISFVNARQQPRFERKDTHRSQRGEAKQPRTLLFRSLLEIKYRYIVKCELQSNRPRRQDLIRHPEASR